MIREVRIRSCDEYSFTLSPSTGRLKNLSLREVEKRLAANWKRRIEQGRFNMNTSSPPVRTKH